MALTFIRTVILYIAVIVAMRLMGKRTIGEMHPTEMVVAIMISDLATVPMQSLKTPLFDGLVPIFTLVIMETIFAFLLLKSRIIRRVLVGHSAHLVRNGELIYENMAKLRVTVDDIEEQIRLNSLTSLKDVSEIIIETNGQVSVIPKKAASPVINEDVDVEGEENITPFVIIADGRLRQKELSNAKITHRDVEREMKKHGVESIEDVLYMSAANSKVVHFQKMEED